jgi:hypothetical protein
MRALEGITFIATIFLRKLRAVPLASRRLAKGSCAGVIGGEIWSFPTSDDAIAMLNVPNTGA